MSHLFRVVDQGEEAFLDLMLAVGYTMRLYTNDVTTGLSDAAIDALDETDFTEATFTGYSSVALTGGSWTTTQGDPTRATYTQQSFASTADQTQQDIYGYYMTRTSDGALMWLEQFDGPIAVAANGDTILVTPTITLDDTEGNEVQTGIITAFGGSTAPDGYLLCDGSAVSRTTYASLFAVLGTTHGVGDGSTTFNLPDLQQRFPLGKAASGTGATLGETGGSIDHVHDLNSADSAALITMQSAGSVSPYMLRKTSGVATWSANVQVTSPHNAAVSSVTGINGGATLSGSSDTENPPYIALNFIIKD